MQTGFTDLDEIMSLDGKNLIVLASRPAMGKSILGQNIVNNIAIKQNLPVLYFNLESSKEEIVKQLICNNCMISYSDIEKGKIYRDKGEELKKCINRLSESKIYIDDTTAISIDEICEKSKKMKVEKDIKIIVIDYLQLISYKKEAKLSRNQEIAKINIELKKLSEELNIPILIISQLSRAPEKRPNHRPILSDFHESYSLVQEADVILFLYRDEYYEEETEEVNIAEVIIAKNKNGKCTIVKILSLLKYCKFVNLGKVEK